MLDLGVSKEADRGFFTLFPKIPATKAQRIVVLDEGIQIFSKTLKVSLREEATRAVDVSLSCAIITFFNQLLGHDKRTGTSRGGKEYGNVISSSPPKNANQTKTKRTWVSWRATLDRAEEADPVKAAAVAAEARRHVAVIFMVACFWM